MENITGDAMSKMELENRVTSLHGILRQRIQTLDARMNVINDRMHTLDNQANLNGAETSNNSRRCTALERTLFTRLRAAWKAFWC